MDFYACSSEGKLIHLDIFPLEQYPDSVLTQLTNQDPSLILLDKFITKHLDTEALENLRQFFIHGVWFKELFIQDVDDPYSFLGFNRI